MKNNLEQKKKFPPTDEQQKVLDNKKKNLIVSASAGSGKTHVVIEYLIGLICDKKIPVNRLLVLTFTRAAAAEMKTRLTKAILEKKPTPFLLEQLDEISISDISTIDAFCEKLIRRHSNLSEGGEDFKVGDEGNIASIERAAFERAMEEYGISDAEGYEKLQFAFKRNNDEICKALKTIKSFFDSLSSNSEDYSSKIQQFHTEAEKYLQNHVIDCFKKASNLLENICQELSKSWQSFVESLQAVAGRVLEGDIYQISDSLASVELLRTPSAKLDSDTKDKIVSAKQYLSEGLEIAGYFQKNSDGEQYQKGKEGLEWQLYQLFEIFLREYKDGKDAAGLVDFADLEKMVGKLLENKEVLDSLQKSYDYIFIDEYQDTNDLQSTIIKSIAAGGNFIAVGDPKQGIYGFRNASMEIMQKDISNFSSDADSQALYLKGNFRSDKRVLEFINDIFQKVMTEDSVGIDYKAKSMLEGLANFQPPQMSPVSVDVVRPIKDQEPQPNGLYDIASDQSAGSDESLEAAVIVQRIDELLGKEIFDAKKQCFRKIGQGDIAVLFRSRNKTMSEVARTLEGKGYSVVADIKQSVADDGQIALLVSLLRLVVNFSDDISLASVLNSWIGGFTLDELAVVRINSDRSKPLWQSFDELTSQKKDDFLSLFEGFKFDCFTLGITAALQKLFNQKDFYSFLSTLPDRTMKNYNLQQFFKLIHSGEYEYNIPALLAHIDDAGSDCLPPQQTSDAIIVTTIHATKGLEYPVVILAGCGESFSKTYREPYIISDKFGLATHIFDFDHDCKYQNPAVVATKLAKKRREWIDEIMIFYVALTRAQNHLYLVGKMSDKSAKDFPPLEKCTNYFELLFFALGKDFKKQLLEQGQIRTENRHFSIIDSVEFDKEQALPEQPISQPLELDDVKGYINFKYPNREDCEISLKNSVTGLLHIDDESEQNLSTTSSAKFDERAIDRGNSFHAALCFVDFGEVDSIESLKSQLDNNAQLLANDIDNIDVELLFKNIMLIKSVAGNARQYKERQFIMSCSLSELGIRNSEEEVLVQGIVDFFALGEKNLLIDYKYTSQKDESVLLERYGRQIELYKMAIEKAFDIKIEQKYLLSLKEAKLIKV